MSGYLDRLVGRTLGLLPTLQPRPRSRFEPAAPTGTEVVESFTELDGTGHVEHGTWPGDVRAVDRVRRPRPVAAQPPGLVVHDSDEDDGGPSPGGIRGTDVGAADPVGDWAPWPRDRRRAPAPGAVRPASIRAAASGTAVPDAPPPVADLLGRQGLTLGVGTARGATAAPAPGGASLVTTAGPGRSELPGARGVDREVLRPSRAVAARVVAAGLRAMGRDSEPDVEGPPVHAARGADPPLPSVIAPATAGRAAAVTDGGPEWTPIETRATTGRAAAQVTTGPVRVAGPVAVGRPSPLGAVGDPGVGGASVDDALRVPAGPWTGGTVRTPPASAEPTAAAPGPPDPVAGTVPTEPARAARPTPVSQALGARTGQEAGAGDHSGPDGAVAASIPAAQVRPSVVVPDPPVAVTGHHTRGERPPEGRTPDPPAPRVTVTIGRVEVRTPPAPPPETPGPEPGPQQLSLDAYLDRRNGGPR